MDIYIYMDIDMQRISTEYVYLMLSLKDFYLV